jgi:ribonuclease Z
LRATIAVLAAVGCLVTGCVEQRLRKEFTRGDRSLLTSPGMTLALCGTGTGLSDARRAGPCTAVVAAGRLFLVDVGSGAFESADLGGLPITALDTVLFTKLLADDVADLGEVIVRTSPGATPLRYGPPARRASSAMSSTSSASTSRCGSGAARRWPST